MIGQPLHVTDPKKYRLLCQEAYEMRLWEGESYQAIAHRLGVDKDVVHRWYTQPELYDPYIDDIAVERALKHDGLVYSRLTVWEMDLVLDRLAVMQETQDLATWTETIGAYSKAWGVTSDSVTTRLRRRRQRAA